MLIIYNSFAILSIIILEKSENNYTEKGMPTVYINSSFHHLGLLEIMDNTVIKHKNGSNTSDRNESIRTVPLVPNSMDDYLFMFRRHPSTY